MCFILSWNDFFYALILTRTRAMTAPVAIVNFMQYEGWEWGKIAAGGTLVMLPVVAFSIFVRRYLVRGLTTAATIWAVAAIGMASGTAQYVIAVFTTLLILSVLMVLKPIERRFFKRPNEAQVSLIVPRGDGEIERVRAALAVIGAFPMSIRVHELNETDDRLEADVGLPHNRTTADLLRQLRSVAGAKQILISRELIEDRVRAGN